MTDKRDPIAHAARLLREAAEELRQAHAYNNSEGWENETDAKTAYDEHMAAAQALEDWEAAVGAGGVQALSAAPAGFVPVAAFDRLHAHAESLAARLLAAEQAAPKAAPGGQNTVPAEWLEQAYREGWAACRDAETIGEEAEDWAFGNSTANSRMIDAQQAAPQHEVQEPWGYARKIPGCGWGFCSKRQYEEAVADGDETKKLYATPQPAPAPLIARSLAEWHEEDGYVAWWAWNGREWAGEPAWIGTPNCEDWPGYHTHWTPHPEQPVCAALAAHGGK